jgi:hypothetical protein
MNSSYGSMNSLGITDVFGGGGSYLFVGILLVVAVVGIGFFIFYLRSQTMPSIAGFKDMVVTEQDKEEEKQMEEGFYGGVAVGAGIPDCYRSSSEAAQLHDLFAKKLGSALEEGNADFREFRTLLSTLACFKKDLMGVATQVEATRYQPFLTQIDMEPIAETTARCFAKTIPPRDLELSFDKWSKRGHFLIVRLCTAANLTEREVEKAEATYKFFISDLYDIAKDKCLTGTPTIAAEPAPREARPYDADELSGRDYHGYY